MNHYRVSFIGCGKLGKTIAHLLSHNQKVTITGIVNTTLESAQEAVQFIGQGKAYASIETLPHSDIYFITTPDDAIATVCQALVAQTHFNKTAIVVHCSGALSSDVLAPAREQGCAIVNLHPLKSFAHPALSIHSFQGIYCAIEGDLKGSIIIKQLFEEIGGIVFSIDQANKSLYHSASVLANNYLVTLHYQAVQCYVAAGIQEAIANKIVSQLMQDAFSNLQTLSHEDALTGPMQRGDSNTIAMHVAALAHHPELSAIYTSLGLGTLALTPHDEKMKNNLHRALQT